MHNSTVIMKNHLVERIFSATWLGILGYFFVYNLAFFSTNSKHSIFIFLEIIVSIFYILLGFFRRYKILLLSVDDIDKFPVCCVSCIWLGSLAYFTTTLVNSLIYGKYAQVNLVISVVITLLTLLFGWVYLYRLFLFPKVTYLKQYPSLSQRVISAIWFGLIGFLLALIIKQTSGAMVIFVSLLASYLGFTFGYHILLLPLSMRGMIKTIMIGLIGSSYALFIVFLIFMLGMYFSSPYIEGKSLSINSIADFFGASFTLIFIIFPIVSLFICGIGIFFSLIMYLITRLISSCLKNKKSL